MMKIKLLLPVCTMLIAAQLGAVEIIEDMKIRQTCAQGLGELIDAGKVADSKTLRKQFDRKQTQVEMVPMVRGEKKTDLYTESLDSIGIFSTVYKCDNCPNWHMHDYSTAWVLHEDGIMVSNYHVFDKKCKGFGVTMHNGETYHVVEILAADKAADIMVFRVDAENLKPLPMRSRGEDLPVGEPVHIIGHPGEFYFTLTQGHLTRYWTGRDDKCVWMGVTADFAIGSSGAPIIDDCGNVCGMVASTQAIVFPGPKSKESTSFQMSVKVAIPAMEIYELIK